MSIVQPKLSWNNFWFDGVSHSHSSSDWSPFVIHRPVHCPDVVVVVIDSDDRSGANPGLPLSRAGADVQSFGLLHLQVEGLLDTGRSHPRRFVIAESVDDALEGKVSPTACRRPASVRHHHRHRSRRRRQAEERGGHPSAHLRAGQGVPVHQSGLQIADFNP